MYWDTTGIGLESCFPVLTVLLLLFCLPSHRPSLLFSQTFRAVPLTVPELTCWKECFCFYFISSFLESSSDWSSVRWTSLHGLGLGQREAAGSPTQSPFMCCMLTQSCPILCGPMDHSLPGSSIHGISQARILEWVAISLSRGSSQPRDRTHICYVFCICRQILLPSGPKWRAAARECSCELGIHSPKCPIPHILLFCLVIWCSWSISSIFRLLHYFICFSQNDLYFSPFTACKVSIFKKYSFIDYY